jgi:hypothetical protein
MREGQGDPAASKRRRNIFWFLLLIFFTTILPRPSAHSPRRSSLMRTVVFLAWLCGE